MDKTVDKNINEITKKGNNIGFRILKNKIFEIIIFIISISLIIPLFLIIWMIVQKGMSVINWEFIFSERRMPTSNSGGILKDIIGTAILVFWAVIFTLPFGISTGVYLAENRRSKLAFIVQWAIDILQGVPSIVIGLVVSIWLVQSRIVGKSAIAGSVALSFMLLPIIIKSTEETVKMIPDIYKEASIGLGVPYYKTILFVILPSSLSGIFTGLLVGISRIAGETAPLLFTAFGNHFMNTDIFKPINSLPQLIYTYSIHPSPKAHTTAWGASFVLITIILILNLLTKLVVKRWKIKF